MIGTIHDRASGLHLIRITQGSILGLLGVPARHGTVSARHQRLRVGSLCIEPTPSSRAINESALKSPFQILVLM